jgi:hypothetical protein
MIDNYDELRNRVQDFGDLYFNNTSKELLDEMEEYIYGESDKFEKDIMENVLQSKSYSEKIKKEAEELLESANMERGIMTTALQEIAKSLSANDTFIQDEGLESRWELVKTKTVLDDGLLTDYSWYKDNEGHHVMILGDTDLYTPNNSSPDMEFDNEAEAKEWFANYEGSESEEDPLADYTNELWSYYDDTPSGILNIYDSIKDSDVNDVFVQDGIEDPNDEYEVWLYNHVERIYNKLKLLREEILKLKENGNDLEDPENKELYDRYLITTRAWVKANDMLHDYQRDVRVKKADARLKKYNKEHGITDEAPNSPENKMKIALEYVARAIDDAKIENDHIVQTITLYNGDFDYDDDYREIDDNYYKVSDGAIEGKIEYYTEEIAGEYPDNETGLGFDFEVDYDFDYDNDAYLSIEYHPGNYWEPGFQDIDESGSVEINIYYYVKIK